MISADMGQYLLNLTISNSSFQAFDFTNKDKIAVELQILADPRFR